MNYRDYIFEQKKKPNYWKLTLRWAKIVLYLFLVVSLLWGCGEIFIPKYNSYKVADISGQNVYKPGVFFEIVIGAIFGKQHYFHMTSDGSLHEYSYLAISSWKQAFVKTQSPFFGCFVYPIAWLLVQIIRGFGGTSNGAGVIGAIFITSLIVRSITLVFSFKAQMNQEKMQALQLRQSAITAKYKGSKDPAAKQKQQMEIMQMYRKENMSPIGAIGTTFLSFPFLFAMYSVIKSTRQLRITKIGGIQLVNQPWGEITSGHWVYLALIAVYLPMQIMSMLLPTLLSLRSQKIVTEAQKKARRKQFIIQGVMMVVFVFFVFSIASGVAIYWIFSAFIQILQTLFFHWLRYSKKARRRQGLNLDPWYKRMFNKLPGLTTNKRIIGYSTGAKTLKPSPQPTNTISYNPLANSKPSIKPEKRTNRKKPQPVTQKKKKQFSLGSPKANRKNGR